MLSRIIVIAIVFAIFAPARAATLASLEERLEKDPSQTKVRETLAKAYLKKRNYAKVIELLAPYSNEVSVPSIIRLADAYEARQDYVNQIRTLELYQQREPDAYRPYHLLGVAYKNNKQIDQAVNNLRRAIELAPKHRPSYDVLLEIMIEKNNQYEARTVLAQMLRQFGPRPEILNMQCKLYSQGGFLAEAEQSCKAAIAKSKKVPENHVYLAQALLDQGRKTAAENVLIQAARHFPESEYVQFIAGEFYYNEKNYAPAVRYLKQGVAANPEAARSHLGLALSLFELKKHAEALPHFEKACKLDKTRQAYTDFRSALSRLRQNMSQVNIKVLEEYEKKIALCP